MSTTVYSQVLIYTAESTGTTMERTKMPNLRNGTKGDSNPGSLDCESGILPLSYRAPYIKAAFCHHGDTICHPTSGYVTTKLHGTSTCGCNNNAIFSGRYCQVSCCRRMPATLIGPRQSIGWPCQSGKMAALLN